jgi:hypothetical protein
VIETGHSLGGQEADFVTSQNTTSTSTEAVTFDAPGIGPAAQTASSTNAVNISNVNDVIHDAGGTYVGNETTVSAPASTLIDSAVGQALGAPLGGMGMLVGGVLGNELANHAINDIAGYLSANPALAGVDLSIYSADQINQAVVNALAAMTPSQYYAMSSVQRANFLEGVFSQYVSTGTNSGSPSPTDIQEAFAVVSSGPGAQTLTGSVGDSVTLSSSGNALTSTASNGYTDTESFDATTGALTGDTWKNAIGTNGSDTYAADGSSTGTVTYADGNYATTLDDGQGNITTDYYTQDGVEIRSTWVHSDGSSGTVNMFADGTTRIPGGGTYDVPTTASIILQNPDGSYTAIDWNANNTSTTANYAANGGQTSQSTGTGTGVNDLSVASSQTGYAGLYAAGEEITYNDNASGMVVGDSWYAANPDGTVNPNGVYVAWAQATASSGTEVDNASGVIVKSATALDGSLYQDTLQLQGDTVSHLTSDGTLLSDNWTITDGPSYINAAPSVTGSDTFNADGSGQGTFSDVRDDSAGTVTLDGQGDIVVVNTNASGTVTSEDTWNASTDSYTIATLNGNGTTLASYDYLANDNVIATDYAPDGTTIADQQTVAAGLVVNPDGSSFSKVMNADGSYTVYYLNASGDTTAYQYSAGGQLTGSYHTSNYDWPRSGWSSTFASGALAGTPWTSADNAFTPTFTDAQGNAWTAYLNAAGQETGGDWVNAAAGTHGYVTFGSDGSQYDVNYNADGTYNTVANDGQGNITQEDFDATGVETGDSWQMADGSRGGDTYNADGSSSGSSFNADGSSSSYTDDGKGDVVTADFSAAGVKLSQAWTNADGTSGNETFSTDGSTATTSYNADGSYSITSNDGRGDITQANYNSAGTETSDAWQKADGSTGSDTFLASGLTGGLNVLAIGESTDANGVSSQYQTILNGSGLVETDTTFYASGGTETGYSKAVTTTNNDGSSNTEIDTYSADGTLSEALSQQFNSSGVFVSDSWVKSDGSVGTDTFNSNGSQTRSTTDPAGDTTDVTTDSAGNSTTATFQPNGTLASIACNPGNPNVTTTSVTNADGSITTTSTNSEDGSSSAKTVSADGSFSLKVSDGQGDINTFAYSAAGTLTADAWTTASGTSGADTFNADGSSSGTAAYANGETSAYTNDGQGGATTKYYTSSGQLASDAWTVAGGSSGNDTFNSDGSSYGVDYQANGSFSTYTNDGQGDVTTQDYSADGTLLGQTESGNSGSTTTAYNADGSYVTTATTAGGVLITTYSASNVLLSDTWTKTDGTSGSDTFNADGSSTGRTDNPDGSYSTYTNDGAGDLSTDNFNATGTLVTQVVAQNGDTTTTSYNADGSYTVGKDLNTGEIITDNYSASNILLSDAWTQPDGSSGTDTYNSDGSSSSTIYHPDGSYVVTTTDTSGTSTATHYAANGTALWATQISGGTTTTTVLNGYVPGNSAYQDFLADGMVSTSQAGTLNASTGYSILGGGAPYPGNGVNVQIKLGNGANLAAIATDSIGEDPAVSVFMPGGGVIDLPNSQSIAAEDSGQTFVFPGVSDVGASASDVTISSGGNNVMDWGLYGSSTAVDTKWETLLSAYDAQLASAASLAANGPAASNNNPTTGNPKVIILSPDTVLSMGDANNGVLKLPPGTFLQENFGNIGDSSNPPEAAPIGDGIHVSWFTETITNSTTTPPPIRQSINTVSNTVNIPPPVNVPLDETIENAIGGETTEHWVAASGSPTRIGNIDGPQIISSAYSGPGGYSAEYQNSGWQPYTTSDSYTNYQSTDQGSISQNGTDILTFTNKTIGNPYFQGSGVGHLEESIKNSSLSLALGNLKTSVTYGDSNTGNSNNLGSNIRESFTENGDTLTLDFAPINTYSADWLQEEDWATADGSIGKIFYNADGSSTGHIQYTDGNYSILLADANGGYLVDNYAVGGQLTSQIWRSDSGDQGTDFFTPGAPASSSTTTNADGSYTQQTVEANGNVYTNTYSASGILENASWDLTSGSSGVTAYNADGSYISTTTDAKGNVSIDNYAASGTLLRDFWQRADGMHGSDSYSGGILTQSAWTNSDGSYGDTVYNTDGSYTSSAVTATGNTTVDNYSTSGVLLSDSWTDANGQSGSDTYVNGVISSDTWADASGVTGTDSYNASGALTYSEWTNTDGSLGSDTYDGSGTLTMTTATDVSGNETIQTLAGTNTIDLTNNPIVLTNSGATDTVDLGASVAPDQLWFQQSGANLIVNVLGGNESLTVQNWYSGTSNQIASFIAGNGQALSGSNVDQLVQAMAAFSPPMASQTSYTTAEATNLDPVIAANWH